MSPKELQILSEHKHMLRAECERIERGFAERYTSADLQKLTAAKCQLSKVNRQILKAVRR